MHEVNDNNLAILRALCSLYCVFGIVQYSGEFTMVTDLTDTHCTKMPSTVMGLRVV